MKKILILLAFVMLLSGCRGLQRVQDIPSHTVVLAEGKTMRDAIMQGCAGKRWIMSEDEPGVVTARLLLRRHMAEVKIPYTQNAYAIEYADSSRLHYNPQKHKIHSKYNQWVRNLDTNIARFAQKR